MLSNEKTKYLVRRVMYSSQTAGKFVNENTLVNKTLTGDLEAFNHLVLAYQDAAYTLAFRILGNSATAEDITQDAFLSAYRKLNSFRYGSFKAWLLRIVTNACYDELRRQKRRSTMPIYPLDGNNLEIESPHWLKDPGKTPEEAVMQSELSAVIQKCLYAIKIDYRIVVILVDILGMSYAEAAKVTDVPLGTIKSRLRRARLDLINRLEDYSELL
jgi:RNA polymerase sigma-70 factor (ECF subfamily)